MIIGTVSYTTLKKEVEEKLKNGGKRDCNSQATTRKHSQRS